MNLELDEFRVAPDADYLKVGNFFSCTNMIPTYRGSYKPAYCMVSAGYNPVASSLGASILKRSNGTVGVYVGTTTTLREADGATSFTDRSKGGGYTNTATSWQFSIYGNITIATNNVDTPQFASGAGATFADLTGAPKAKCIAVLNNIVLLFNYDNGTRFEDGWFGSDAGAYNVWTATSANEVANGRLTDTAGPINAAATLNSTVIAWKSRGMYLGRYVSGDKKWDWQLLSADIGCVAPDAWVHTDIGIVFASERDIFLYDGSGIRPIGDGEVKNLLFNSAVFDNTSSIKLQYEPSQSLVYVFVNTQGGANCDYAHVWNHQSQKWGQAGRAANGRFGVSGFTYVSTVFRNSNYADIRSRAFASNPFKNSAMVIESGGNPVIFGGDSGSYTGGETSSLTSGVYGEPDFLWTVERITPVYLGNPPTADSMTLSFGMDNMSLLAGSVAGSWNATNLRFDVAQQAKSFQFLHTTTGEVTKYSVWYTKGKALE